MECVGIFDGICSAQHGMRLGSRVVALALDRRKKSSQWKEPWTK